MTIKDALKRLNGKNVKIGSGVAFVYCGVVDDGIIEALNQESSDYYEALVEEQQKYKHRKEFFENIWANNHKRMKTEFKKKKEGKKWDKAMKKAYIREYKNYKKRMALDKKTTNRKLKEIPKKIASFKDFPDRTIKDVYTGIYGDTIIIFKGREIGNYWDASEYKEAHKNEHN